MISEASYDFGFGINIVTGRVDGIAGEPFGVMALLAYGPAAAIAAVFCTFRLCCCTNALRCGGLGSPTLQAFVGLGLQTGKAACARQDLHAWHE